jgi:hypothetical protein
MCSLLVGPVQPAVVPAETIVPAPRRAPQTLSVAT